MPIHFEKGQISGIWHGKCQLANPGIFLSSFNNNVNGVGMESRGISPTKE